MIVCDWWSCANFEDCKDRCIITGSKYPPCYMCVHYDMCDVCTEYVNCADLVTRYLPNMFRRLVRDIRLGEDTERTNQSIRRNTLGGQKRDV